MKIKKVIGVIGLGYVGLPLLIEFGKIRKVIGFDLNVDRINQLKSQNDVNKEINKSDFKKSKFTKITSNINDLKKAQIFIIAVPTPIDKNKNPDLSYLLSVTKMLAKILKIGDIVIYESTVYPGVTEEVCAPLIESETGLRFNSDFFCGYSPERINPGDKNKNLVNIVKVTSGSNREIAKEIDNLYGEIINAGTFMTSSIKVAEAAKVIENTQRDINIALMNELSLIFNKLELDTNEILEAAGTKWNFLKFYPGLVGGHCIGVDPYYLTHKAKEIGIFPEVILAGRSVNDRMPNYVVSETIKLMILRGISVKNSKVLLLGLTFKENCPDLRNSKVFEIFTELKSFGVEVFIHDPEANSSEVFKIYGLQKNEDPLKKNFYDAIILCVAHDSYKNLGIKAIQSYNKKNSVFFDLKNCFGKNNSDLRL